MMNPNGFNNSHPLMAASHTQYVLYCKQQKEKQVTIMCIATRKIRGMTAQQLLEFSGQGQVAPTNLRIILEKAGISALPKDFSQLEQTFGRIEGKDDVHILGALVTNDQNAAIFYNKNDAKDGHRYRFTIAHELAHCCLAHYGYGDRRMHIEFRRDDSGSKEEIMANIFAGELLIPRNVLDKVLNELILPSVYTLSEIFAVSENVMLARLKYLKISRSIVGYNF